MSNRTGDIGVRIVADYAQALKDLQTFVGSAGKEFGSLPKIVQQAGTAVDGLTEKVKKVGESSGPRDLQHDLSTLPPIVEKVSASINQASSNLEKMGSAGARGLRQTNDEASKLSRTLDKIVTGGKAAGAVMAGWQAGKMVLMPSLEKQMDYSAKLAHLANTTYGDKSVAERIAGKAELNDAITYAWRNGGGTREDSLSALDKMIASGAVSTKDAQIMLPAVVRGATASNAAPEEIAGIAIRGMQNFGFKADELPAVIDMAIKSGQAGGFELKDMSKWLPQQMAEAATLGMKGKKGFAQLLSLNQAAITAAGTTDGAGNNVVNLLAKINSTDTQKDFQKQGINLTGSLQAAIGKGIDPITAFSKLIDGIMKKDKGYQALETKLKGAGSDKEKTSIIEQQLQLAEGTAIGKVLQDRQARSAYLGYKKQGDAFGKMVDDTLNGSAGTTTKNYAVVSSETGFQRQMALNEGLNAQTTALSKLNPALNTYYDYVVKNAQAHPALTVAMEGGKLAVTTLGAGAGTASIVMALLTKNAAAASAALGGVAITGGGKIPGVPGLPPGVPAAAGKLAPLAVGGAKVLAGVAVLAGATYGLSKLLTVLDGDGTDSLNHPGKRRVRRRGHADTWETDNSLPQDHVGEHFVRSGRGGSWLKDDPDPDKVSKAFQRSLNAQPIEIKGKIEVAINEQGKPYVNQQSISGNGVRLDTGPMMVH